MAKAKAVDSTKKTEAGPEIVKIERGPWEIDVSTITEIADNGDGQFTVFTTAGSYRLTAEERELLPELPPGVTA